MSDKNVYFCPQCGSAAVDYSALVGGDATCRGCKWSGPATDLLGVPMRADVSEEQLAVFMNDLRQLLAGPNGVVYLSFLLKWGFLKGDVNRLRETVDRKQFARYIAAIARGIAVALFDERERVEVKGKEDAAHGSA